MQPIKSMRRALESGEKAVDWEIAGGGEKHMIVSKETLGAKAESEFFDPVEILLKAGYPKDRIHLVGIMREPAVTLTSWTWMWDKVSMRGFLRAYRETAEMMERAGNMGVAATHYVHEAIRDNGPEGVVGKLMARVARNNGKGLDTRAVNWSAGPNFDKSAQVKFFDDPPERFVHAVKTWGGYQYRELTSEITYEQERRLIKGGARGIYAHFLKMCQRDLGITIGNRRAGDLPPETNLD